MQKGPRYPVASIDRIFRLMELFRQRHSVGVSEAAGELGVAPSTAHRLLAMLVGQGLVQPPSMRGGRYEATPTVAAEHFSSGLSGDASAFRLLSAVGRSLYFLRQTFNETANVKVLVGSESIFIGCLPPPRRPRVRDREGELLPAVRSAGGKAIISFLSEPQVEMFISRYALPHESVLQMKRRTLQQHVAINLQETDAGIAALGYPIYSPGGAVLGSLTVAMPVERFPYRHIREASRALTLASRQVTHRLGVIAAQRNEDPLQSM